MWRERLNVELFENWITRTAKLKYKKKKKSDGEEEA